MPTSTAFHQKTFCCNFLGSNHKLTRLIRHELPSVFIIGGWTGCYRTTIQGLLQADRAQCSLCAHCTSDCQNIAGGICYSMIIVTVNVRCDDLELVITNGRCYSPDAGTALLSQISYKGCNTEFYYVGKIPRICIGCPSLQRRVLLKWFYLPRAVELGTPLSEVHALYRVHFYSCLFIWLATQMARF